MPESPSDAIDALLAAFSSDTRLNALAVEGVEQPLLVEAFLAHDEVNVIGFRDVVALSIHALLDLPTVLGTRATLAISLANGTGLLSPATSPPWPGWEASTGSPGCVSVCRRGYGSYPRRAIAAYGKTRRSSTLLTPYSTPTVRLPAGAGATKRMNSWGGRVRAVTAASTGKLTLTSCGGCWRRRGCRGGRKEASRAK